MEGISGSGIVHTYKTKFNTHKHKNNPTSAWTEAERRARCDVRGLCKKSGVGVQPSAATQRMSRSARTIDRQIDRQNIARQSHARQQLGYKRK